MVTVWESVSHGLALGLDNEALLWAGTPHPQHSPAPTPLELRQESAMAKSDFNQQEGGGSARAHAFLLPVSAALKTPRSLERREVVLGRQRDQEVQDTGKKQHMARVAC